MDKFNSDGVKIISVLGGGGGGLTNINISAGTTSQNLSDVVFSNSNKLSFGLNGSTITAIFSGINALGASNTGNTAGNTGVSTGIDWVLAGTNNITISESTAAGGPNTLWFSAPSPAGGAVNFSAGTTSSDLGSVVFSDSNKLSFGLNGATITAKFSGINALGASNTGNTAGNTGVSTGIDWVIAGTNNVTVSESTAVGGPNTLWLSAAAGGGANINVSAGTTSNDLSNIVFSNSNNVSFGLNGSTITATATVATSLSNIRVSAGTTSNLLSAVTFSNSNNVEFGINASTITASVSSSLTNIRVSAGTTSNLLSAITFSNSNGVSFGINASTLTASHNGLTSQSTQFEAVTLGGNTAGTTTFHATNNDTLFLNGGANITLSGNGSTITIIGEAGGGGGGPATLSYFNNMLGPHATSTLGMNLGSRFLFVIGLNGNNHFPGVMTVDTMWMMLTGTYSTGAGFTRTISVGFYTAVNSTQLSLAFSASTSWGTGAADMNLPDSFAGNRWLTFQSSQWNNPPAFSNDQIYYFAWWNNTSGGTQNISWYGASLYNTGVLSGFMSVVSDTNASKKWYPFNGAYSVSFSTAMPNSLAAADLRRNAAAGSQGYLPWIQFNNIGSDIV